MRSMPVVNNLHSEKRPKRHTSDIRPHTRKKQNKKRKAKTTTTKQQQTNKTKNRKVEHKTKSPAQNEAKASEFHPWRLELEFFRSRLPCGQKNTACKMLKTTTPHNRWKIFSISPVPSCRYICLVWQHHHVLQTSATACKRLIIGPKGSILLKHFETTCVRNVLIVKISRATQILRLVPRDRRKIDLSVLYIFIIMLRLLWPHETVLQTSATDIQNRKGANYFSDSVVVSGPTI